MHACSDAYENNLITKGYFEKILEQKLFLLKDLTIPLRILFKTISIRGIVLNVVREFMCTSDANWLMQTLV